jgi:hypothetical protein
MPKSVLALRGKSGEKSAFDVLENFTTVQDEPRGIRGALYPDERANSTRVCDRTARVTVTTRSNVAPVLSHKYCFKTNTYVASSCYRTTHGLK